MKNPGLIFDLRNGKYGIAYNKDQTTEYKSQGKLILKVFDDQSCTIPTLDPKGKQEGTIRRVNDMTLLGYND